MKLAFESVDSERSRLSAIRQVGLTQSVEGRRSKAVSPGGKEATSTPSSDSSRSIHSPWEACPADFDRASLQRHMNRFPKINVSVYICTHPVGCCPGEPCLTQAPVITAHSTHTLVSSCVGKLRPCADGVWRVAATMLPKACPGVAFMPSRQRLYQMSSPLSLAKLQSPEMSGQGLDRWPSLPHW